MKLKEKSSTLRMEVLFITKICTKTSDQNENRKNICTPVESVYQI